MNTTARIKRFSRWMRSRPRRAIGVYALLLVLSNITQVFVPRAWFMLPADNRIATQIPTLDRHGPTDGHPITLSALVYGPEPGRADEAAVLPVVLIHGSPGQATDFKALGPELAARGRGAYALDMPGFGMSSGWVSDYSARAYARDALAFMDELGIERAHIVGWSNGGAVALNAADIAPDRIASITLLAAIACQETEGSGDYHFEHAKYALGYAAVVVMPELIPHFGLLFPRQYRHAFIRNFWDTDQRPIRGIMESLETPTLILHGRHDPLVSDWAAERHHELIPTSRLVMTEHSHFLPFMQPVLTAGYLEAHFARHDTPGVAPRTDELILEPPAGRPWFRRVLSNTRAMPWAVVTIVLIPLAAMRRESATAIAGVLVGHGVWDFGVVFLGLFLGRLAVPPSDLRRLGRSRQSPLRVVSTSLRTLAWTGLSLLIAQVCLGNQTGIGESGLLTVVAAVLGVAVLLNIVKRLPTRTGRRELAVFLRRCLHHEWWPNWVLYTLLIPHFLRLAIRHRSLTVWSCVNPGIEPGGGIVGESKAAILAGLDPACALTQIRIDSDANHDARAKCAHNAVIGTTSLGYPVVIKPEMGERGDRVSIVRTERDLAAALAAIPGGAILQRYHPGPVELGVFWVRDRATVGNERTDTAQGSIFAVTRKILPDLACDGERSIREQILAHKRYRMQAQVYFQNLKSRLDERPPAGDRVRLTEIGNHIKGCRFEDGSDLITPELSSAIDRMARTWRGADGEPFDFGRFDLRCSSVEAARAGEDLAIIELNGITSEATNLYDPGWSPRRALRLLGRQWSLAFNLGAARRAAGQRPIGVAGIVRALRQARP